MLMILFKHTKNTGLTEVVAGITDKEASSSKNYSQQKWEMSCFYCGYTGHLCSNLSSQAKGNRVFFIRMKIKRSLEQKRK